MFRARMTKHAVQEPEKSVDGLGFESNSYGEPRDAQIYITFPAQTQFNQNEFLTSRFDAVGFTFEDLPEGTKIDGRWIVGLVYDESARRGRVLALTAIGGE